MPLNCLEANADWEFPVFKILANNDTGSAPGHQGGILVPSTLRQYFPQLQGRISPESPTIDQRIEAELFVENEHIATVNTRYQYQTWTGARSPESRLTDRLGALRNLAKGGDVLIIQRRLSNPNYFRLTLVRQSSPDYPALVDLIGPHKWGALSAAGPIVEDFQAATPDDKQDKHGEAAKLLDPSILPYWAAVAYVARCARRFLECYEKDQAEPSSQRATVSQAVLLAESMAAKGGPPSETGYLELNDQFFDNYDFEAIEKALIASEKAAENTYADLHEDKSIERSLAQILTAISLARLAVTFAFTYERSASQESASAHVRSAIDYALWGEPDVESALVEDFNQLVAEIRARELADYDPVPPEVFGELWPDGQPVDWPAMRLSFRPRARIIRTIGDRLVSGPEAAVIELVKNSYDADASFVRITFVPPLQQNAGAILFEDDGHGMTLADIEHKWMEPATSEKRDGKFSKRGRRVLGSKGIGRFAASRLGRFLELVSTGVSPVVKANTIGAIPSVTRLTTTRIPALDWNAFEETKYLDDVNFIVESLPARSATGTSLKVSSLRDEWSEQKILKLHEELRKLISPITKPGTEFRIFLDLSHCTLDTCSFDGLSVLATSSVEASTGTPNTGGLYEVRPYPLLDACDYAVDGVFDESGHFEGTMTIKRGGLEPEKISLDVPLQLEEGEEACGVVLVRLHVFDREGSAVRNTVANAGFSSIGVREARKLLDNISGVAIYREGFRIRPYGDGENDWLTLDAKRVQNPSIKIGRNQIAGVVTVDDEKNSHLIERSSREGLEENGSFARLRSLISALLAEVVEPKRRRFRLSAGIDNKKETSFRDIYDRVQMGWSKLLVAKLPEADRPEAEELITKESERLTLYVKRLEERQAQLEARVTLGLIIGEVMHQGNTPLSFLETETSRLRRWWPTLFDSSTRAGERLQEVPRILNGMEASGEKLRVLFDALNPLSGARRGDPIQYDVLKVINQTFYLFKSKVEKVGIRVSVLPNSGERIATGYPNDLATAVTNLIDNAIFWLDYHNIPDPKIVISVVEGEAKTNITIEDNGTGIPQEFADQLFDIGFTLKPNGTGLGLSIAKEAISRSNGTLELIESETGAAFQVTLPSASFSSAPH